MTVHKNPATEECIGFAIIFSLNCEWNKESIGFCTLVCILYVYIFYCVQFLLSKRNIDIYTLIF